jgi:hypothetical protein
MCGGQKHKGIAQKQDISEDHRKFAGSKTSKAKNSPFPHFFDDYE